jgi:hypothetical protein
MKINESNTIIKNVLSQQEIDTLYEIIGNQSEQYVLPIYSQKVSDFDLPDEISKKIIRYCEEVSGVSGLVLYAYQFARYQNHKDSNGEIIRPMLSPHWDGVFQEPRFTFDYQIGGNTTWGLTVEDRNFVLNNNEAITFSGTHQVHWRPHKIFKDNEYMDMIFCHLEKPGLPPLSQEHRDYMESKEVPYLSRYLNALDSMDDFYSSSTNVGLNQKGRENFYQDWEKDVGKDFINDNV